MRCADRGAKRAIFGTGQPSSVGPKYRRVDVEGRIGARGVGGYYAYPWHGYDHGFDPGADVYEVPYARADIAELEPFSTTR